MGTIKVYVRGDIQTPERFWNYALLTNYKQESDEKMYIDKGFRFSQKDTDLYKSFSENDKKKINFFYVNGTQFNN